MSPAALIVLAALFGAFAMPLYALSVAHANDRSEGQDFVTIGSGVLLLFGAGSALGAPIAGSLMASALGSGGLFGFVGVVLIGLIMGVAWRRRQRATPVQEPSDQPFIPVSELNPIALDLDPLSHQEDDRSRQTAYKGQDMPSDRAPPVAPRHG
jgi:MFS family permease